MDVGPLLDAANQAIPSPAGDLVPWLGYPLGVGVLGAFIGLLLRRKLRTDGEMQDALAARDLAIAERDRRIADLAAERDRLLGAVEECNRQSKQQVVLFERSMRLMEDLAPRSTGRRTR